MYNLKGRIFFKTFTFDLDDFILVLNAYSFVNNIFIFYKKNIDLYQRLFVEQLLSRFL